MTTPNENGRGDSVAHICINCGEDVRPDGFAEGRAMFTDAEGNRTCETLGGGEETPAHFVNPEQMPQGDSALREEEINLMRIAAKISAFLKEPREFPNPSDYHPSYAAE
jgi:hypothetical protein